MSRHLNYFRKYRKRFFLYLGPIVFGIILANLTWFFEQPITPAHSGRGLPFPFFIEVVEGVCIGGECRFPRQFDWGAYFLDLILWVLPILAIMQFIKLCTKILKHGYKGKKV